jgi:4'-phosphopantetheinyl transferase EntD
MASLLELKEFSKLDTFEDIQKARRDIVTDDFANQVDFDTERTQEFQDAADASTLDALKEGKVQFDVKTGTFYNQVRKPDGTIERQERPEFSAQAGFTGGVPRTSGGGGGFNLFKRMPNPVKLMKSKFKEKGEPHTTANAVPVADPSSVFPKAQPLPPFNPTGNFPKDSQGFPVRQDSTTFPTRQTAQPAPEFNTGGVVGVPVGQNPAQVAAAGAPDNVPAVIDGQQPAEIQSGEVIMSVKAIELAKQVAPEIVPTILKLNDLAQGMNFNSGGVVPSYNEGGIISPADIANRTDVPVTRPDPINPIPLPKPAPPAQSAAQPIIVNIGGPPAPTGTEPLSLPKEPTPHPTAEVAGDVNPPQPQGTLAVAGPPAGFVSPTPPPQLAATAQPTIEPTIEATPVVKPAPAVVTSQPQVAATASDTSLISNQPLAPTRPKTSGPAQELVDTGEVQLLAPIGEIMAKLDGRQIELDSRNLLLGKTDPFTGEPITTNTSLSKALEIARNVKIVQAREDGRETQLANLFNLGFLDENANTDDYSKEQIDAMMARAVIQGTTLDDILPAVTKQGFTGRGVSDTDITDSAFLTAAGNQAQIGQEALAVAPSVGVNPADLVPLNNRDRMEALRSGSRTQSRVTARQKFEDVNTLNAEAATAQRGLAAQELSNAEAALKQFPSMANLGPIRATAFAETARIMQENNVDEGLIQATQALMRDPNGDGNPADSMEAGRNFNEASFTNFINNLDERSGAKDAFINAFGQAQGTQVAALLGRKDIPPNELAAINRVANAQSGLLALDYKIALGPRFTPQAVSAYDSRLAGAFGIPSPTATAAQGGQQRFAGAPTQPQARPAAVTAEQLSSIRNQLDANTPLSPADFASARAAGAAGALTSQQMTELARQANLQSSQERGTDAPAPVDGEDIQPDGIGGSIAVKSHAELPKAIASMIEDLSDIGIDENGRPTEGSSIVNSLEFEPSIISRGLINFSADDTGVGGFIKSLIPNQFRQIGVDFEEIINDPSAYETAQIIKDKETLEANILNLSNEIENQLKDVMLAANQMGEDLGSEDLASEVFLEISDMFNDRNGLAAVGNKNPVAVQEAYRAAIARMMKDEDSLQFIPNRQVGELTLGRFAERMAGVVGLGDTSAGSVRNPREQAATGQLVPRLNESPLTREGFTTSGGVPLAGSSGVTAAGVTGRVLSEEVGRRLAARSPALSRLFTTETKTGKQLAEFGNRVRAVRQARAAGPDISKLDDAFDAARVAEIERLMPTVDKFRKTLQGERAATDAGTLIRESRQAAKLHKFNEANKKAKAAQEALKKEQEFFKKLDNARKAQGQPQGKATATGADKFNKLIDKKFEALERDVDKALARTAATAGK